MSDNRPRTNQSAYQSSARGRRTPKAKTPSPRSRRLHILARFSVISIFFLIIVALIVTSMINTIIIHGDEWNKKGEEKLDTILEVKPLRGDILADDGSILATNLYYYNIRIDFTPQKFMIREYAQSLDSLADTLAKYYPVRNVDQWKARLKQPLNLPKTKRSNSFLLLKEVTSDQAKQIKDFPYFRRSKNRYRTGLVEEKVLKRKYPYGDMAKLSIGYLSELNGRVQGAAGLERALDHLLYGIPGKAKKVMFTNRVGLWTIEEPVPGYTVKSTINVTMQDILETELEKMLVASEAEWGTALLMEVSTGDIKAISNLELDSAKGRGHYHEAMNRAVLGYEPGSVMKTISMVVALEDGFAKPIGKTLYSDPGGYFYAHGRPIRDTHAPADRQVPVSRLLEYSSNIGMTKLIAPHFENNPNGFRERLRELGFFDRFYTGIARERVPYFPTLPNDRGGRIGLSRMIYGYSTMIPPLYTCAIYNAIANDGKFVRPRLVKGLSRRDDVDSVIEVSYIREQLCSPENAKILRNMLHDVIYGSGGTAKSLKSDIVDIAGKTGTCKIVEPGKGYLDNRYRLAFCGFFPFESPKYTCMVLISNPSSAYKSAGRTSGEVLKNVALKLYSRGFLDTNPEITPEQGAEKVPSFIATHNTGRDSTLSQALGVPKVKRISPPASTPPGKVPDVRGLGFREAVVKLEKSGFNVKFNGSGHVASQSPAPGADAIRGAVVTLILSDK